MIPKPLGVRILVKAFEPDSEPTAIWIPDPAMSTLRGAVVEIGEDVGYLQRGDEVLFANQGAIQFEHDRERYYVMPEGRVLALLSRLEQTA